MLFLRPSNFESHLYEWIVTKVTCLSTDLGVIASVIVNSCQHFSYEHYHGTDPHIMFVSLWECVILSSWGTDAQRLMINATHAWQSSIALLHKQRFIFRTNSVQMSVMHPCRVTILETSLQEFIPTFNGKIHMYIVYMVAHMSAYTDTKNRMYEMVI